MTVTETEKGTMVDASGSKTPDAEAKIPASDSRVSSEEEERLYTQSQADALVHAAKSESGRQMKTIETERDNLKSQITTFESKVTDIESERESLQQQIEELSSNDPKKFDLIKKDKDLRDRERNLKSRITDLDNREQNLSEREKKVSIFEMEVKIEEIADDYEDGDSARLKKAISAFENPSEEQIRSIADIIFSKKAESSEKEQPKPKLKVDSGKTRGSSTFFTRTQIADRSFWEANKEEILDAQREGRIRDE